MAENKLKEEDEGAPKAKKGEKVSKKEKAAAAKKDVPNVGTRERDGKILISNLPYY